MRGYRRHRCRDRSKRLAVVPGQPARGVGSDGLAVAHERREIVEGVHALQIGGPLLARNGGGSVTVIGSISGVVAISGQSLYGSAKAALHHLVRCAAMELGPSGVRVLGIRSAAMVDTPTIRWGFQATARAMNLTLDQVTANAAQATVLNRLPVAADTARLAAFLVSDAARSMTGTIVNASSGSILD